MRELDSPQGVSCSKLHCGVVPAIRLSKVLLPKGKPNRVYVCVCVSVCVQMKDLLCLCVIMCMSSQMKDVNRLSGLSVPVTGVKDCSRRERSCELAAEVQRAFRPQTMRFIRSVLPGTQ